MIPVLFYPLIIAVAVAIVLPVAIRLLRPNYFRFYLIPIFLLLFPGAAITWFWFNSDLTVTNPPEAYIRLIKDGNTYKLQAGSQTFINESSGDTVTLFGICHIGDSSFYESLLDTLSNYKTVIFEGVAVAKPEEEDTPQAASGKTVKKKKKVLDIDHGKPANILALKEQSDFISNNYQGWLWCDVTSEQIEEELKKRQATSPPEMAEKTPKPKRKINAQQLMHAQDILQLLNAANNDPKYQRALFKHYLATQDLVKSKRFYTFNNLVKSLEQASSKQSLFNAIILEFRNEFLFDKLDIYLLDPELQNIAVLYGAAHLTGLEEMLKEKGFKRQGDMKWLTITEF